MTRRYKFSAIMILGGCLALTAYAGSGGGSSSPRVRLGEEKRRLVWGQLHEHTSVSKDVPERDGTLVDAYRWARDVADLDFYSTTDHTDMMSDYEARRTRMWADLYNIPGGLVTLYGAEMRLANVEHTNFFAPKREAARRFRRARLAFNRLPPVLERLDELGLQDEVLVIRHFHGRGPNRSAPPLDPNYKKNIEAVQTRGFSPPALSHYLGQGARSGVVGGPDHARPPGGRGGPWVYPYALTGLWVRELTREGVFEALRQRRGYATNGKRIRLWFSADDRPLGSAYQTDKASRFHVRVVGSAPLEEVELIRGGEVIAVRKGDDSTIRLEFEDDKPGEHYYYVRATQERQEDDNFRRRAVSSPIWITRR